ncbi:hypothetical protein DRQ18_03610 [bacterium]|nr:MAG: hypothetical protein DRQ18_03610 [bacterium]
MKRIILISLFVLFCSLQERVELVETWHSDSCVTGEFKDTAVVDVWVEGMLVHVIHYNAYLNCCLDDIAVRVKFVGRVIEVHEHEIVETPCDCLCPFNIVYTLRVPSPGEYVLKIYTEDRLVYVTTIFILGMY